MSVTIVGNNTPTAGSVVYGDGANYASTAAGTSGQLLQSNGSSSPSWVSASAVTIGTATNVAVTANSTNATNYLTFVSATTGNLPELVNSSITCNPANGAITGGVSGGSF